MENWDSQLAVDEKEWSNQRGCQDGKRRENACPIPEAQSLEPSMGTAEVPSRSSKAPPETSMEITGIYCYLGSSISMYGVLHVVQRDTRPGLWFSCTEAGREAGCPPGSARWTDGVV